MVGGDSPTEDPVEKGGETRDDSVLDLDSSSDEEITAAGVMNQLALHSLQHRSRLLRPAPISTSTPSSPSVLTNGHFSLSDNIPKTCGSGPERIRQEVENAFFGRFEKADVRVSGPSDG